MGSAPERPAHRRQPGHKPPMRPVSRERSSSTPSMGAEARSSFGLRERAGAKRPRRRARASAARSGSARAAATARTRGASSLRTWTTTCCRPRLRSRPRCSATADLGRDLDLFGMARRSPAISRTISGDASDDQPGARMLMPTLETSHRSACLTSPDRVLPQRGPGRARRRRGPARSGCPVDAGAMQRRARSPRGCGMAQVVPRYGSASERQSRRSRMDAGGKPPPKRQAAAGGTHHVGRY